MNQLDRRDQLPDYYADLARIPSRSAQVYKRFSWQERIKATNLSNIERLKNKHLLDNQKEAVDLYVKLSYYDQLKRNNPIEIERIEKIKERNNLNLLIKKQQFYETIDKFEQGLIIEPIDPKERTIADKTFRLKSAIKQFRGLSSKTNKSVTFNLSANKFHHDTRTNDMPVSDGRIKQKRVRSLSDLYRISPNVLPELGEEFVFRTNSDFSKKSTRNF